MLQLIATEDSCVECVVQVKTSGSGTLEHTVEPCVIGTERVPT